MKRRADAAFVSGDILYSAWDVQSLMVSDNICEVYTLESE